MTIRGLAWQGEREDLGDGRRGSLGRVMAVIAGRRTAAVRAGRSARKHREFGVESVGVGLAPTGIQPDAIRPAMPRSGTAAASDQIAGAAEEQERTADAGHSPGVGTGQGQPTTLTAGGVRAGGGGRNRCGGRRGAGRDARCGLRRAVKRTCGVQTLVQASQGSIDGPVVEPLLRGRLHVGAGAGQRSADRDPQSRRPGGPHALLEEGPQVVVRGAGQSSEAAGRGNRPAEPGPPLPWCAPDPVRYARYRSRCGQR